VSPELGIGLQSAALPRVTLEQWSARIEQFLRRHKIALVVLLSLVYFGGSVLRARAKPFWYDELLTVLAAQQPSYGATVQAARDLDWTPPFTDLVGHFVHQLAGSGEVAFRVPSMLGFWVFCLCLFGFAARRVNIFFALTALLLPFVTSGAAYSVEARSYGMMLGFCGIALLCWQWAASERERGWALAGMLLGIGGGVTCHYYAVLIYLPLAGAELFRSWRTRRIDKAIWTIFVLGGIPLLVSLAGMLRVKNANPHPLTVAGRQDFLWYYLTTFETALWFLIPVFLLWAAWLLFRGNDEAEAGHPFDIPDYELVAAVLLFLVPVAAITLAIVVPPHIFTDRYALLSIGGFALLTSLVAARFAGRRSTLGLAFALPAVGLFLMAMAHGRSPLQNPLQKEPLLQAALERGPVVINDYVAYLQLWYYAPDTVKPRLLYLSDEDSAVRFSNIDDIMQPLRKYGVPIVNYRDFATPQKDFFLYYAPGFGWVPEKALADGGRVEVAGWAQGKALLHIWLK
jgi:hypothetical protein